MHLAQKSGQLKRAPYGESFSLYGIHFQAPIRGKLNTGGEKNMAEMNTRGWVLFYVYVCLRDGRSNAITTDFRPWADAGYGVLVRVDSCQGSVPHEPDYPSWTARVVNYVKGTTGAQIWIIGNEANLADEYPTYDGYTESVSPQKYAKIFKMMRNGIRSLPNHGTDVVVIQGISRNSAYHREVLLAIGKGNVDGLALHAYTNRHDPTGIAGRFRSEYQGFLNATPEWARSLPVWITEACPTYSGWTDTNNGWVKAMYAEVNAWNQTPGTQKIHGAMIFIWDLVSLPKYDFHNKPQVIQDWREAMTKDYRWTSSARSPKARPAYESLEAR